MNFEALFARADAIEDRRANGLCEPIFWHLAIRGHAPSKLRLAGWYTQAGTRAELGRGGDPFSPLGMMYRAYRQGEHTAAQNLAMSFFNIGDLGGYRYWLSRAARTGDIEARAELKRFELRQPYRLARRLRRLRPFRRGEG